MEKDFSSIEKARKLIKEELTIEDVIDESYQKEKITKKKIEGRQPIALIVDDSISVRKFVASVLNKKNYKTILTSNGEEALSKLESNNFDIVITDLEMPKMHGFDLIEHIRKDKKFKELPIIILTGRAGEKQKEKGISVGANAFIIKPFKESDLIGVIEDFIEGV